MSAFGDNVELVQNGGLKLLELKYDKGLGAGIQYYKLMPATLEEYYLNQPMGIDADTLDDVHIHTWFKHYVRIRFVQMDDDTLEEIHATDFETMIYQTGVPVRFTFFDATTVEITMRFKRGGVGSGGPKDFRNQVWEGIGSTLTSVF